MKKKYDKTYIDICRKQVEKALNTNEYSGLTVSEIVEVACGAFGCHTDEEVHLMKHFVLDLYLTIMNKSEKLNNTI